MKAKHKHILIELQEDVLPRVKARTELIARGNPEIPEDWIIGERDENTIARFFTDFAGSFLSDTGRKEMLDAEDTLIINLTEKEIERGTANLQTTLLQTAEEYILSKWYNALGDLQRGDYHEGQYQKKIREWQYNSVQKMVVQPKYRPYF